MRRIVFGHSDVIDTAVHKIGNSIVEYLFFRIRRHLQKGVKLCIRGLGIVVENQR
jgi:hypothetical protein